MWCVPTYYLRLLSLSWVEGEKPLLFWFWNKMGTQQVFLEPSAGPLEHQHFGWLAKLPALREEGGQIHVSVSTITLIFSPFCQNIPCF